MVCPKCKSEISDDALFCQICGTKVGGNNINDTMNISSTNKSSRKKIIIVGAVCVCMLVGCVIYLMYSNRPIMKWSKLMKSESYESATEYYFEMEDSMSTDDVDLVVETVNKAVEEIYDEYIAGEMNYEVALNQLNKIIMMPITTEKVAGVTEQIYYINESRTAFVSAEEFYDKGEYIKALEYFKLVIPEDIANYENALDRIDSCVNLYRDEIIAEASIYEDANDYASALSIVEVGLTILNNDEELTSYSISLKDEIEAETEKELLAEVKKSYEEGYLADALEDLQEYCGNNSEINVLWDQIENEYIVRVLDEVRNRIKESDIDTAKLYLQDANELVRESEEITGWLEVIDEYYPVSLLDINVFATENSNGNLYLEEWTYGKDTDNLGNSEYAGIKYNVAYTQPTWETCTYVIGGKYDIFSGVFAVHQKSKDKMRPTDWATLSIIGDGVLLYESPIIKGGIYPVEFEVDISGVKELQYRIDAQGGMYFGILNPILEKTLKD